ncbi:MAG TPA: malectin domain-containing carbohydrate-binding protein [Terracidiphilus sp.]|nr:malectin domain-containing carbohydrate-binding protein [Terracidiphilus sp.]
MSLEVVTVMHPKRDLGEPAVQQERLVHRVASSTTFEKSPRLRAFFLHVCRCALEDKPEEATEQQIGIFVYGRPPGYNPNDDNIVRSQARVLRMKLEHHFANEGKDEAFVITIPKGQYLPVFEPRSQQPAPLSLAEVPAPVERKTARPHWLLVAVSALGVLVVLLLGYRLVRSKTSANPSPASVPAGPNSQPVLNSVVPLPQNRHTAMAADADVVRIAAGRTGAPYVDALGRGWGADRFYEGGIVQPGPRHFFPPVPDESIFKSIREAASDNDMVPESDRAFQYNIPLRPGVYELRLYFADPLRQPEADQIEDAENRRHFQVVVNRHPVLVDFDPVADAGYAAVDTRVFRDIYPDTDGKLHLEFRSDWGRAFVSAIELTPGIPGKLQPIRIAAGSSTDIVDANGVRWSADRDYIDGRTWGYQNPQDGPRVAPLYVNERDGNFSYSIPVTPGSYTLRLHFLEAFFSPLIPAAFCHGLGCRVFDVSCNGVSLLQNFDINQTAGGPFKPVIREFHNLHPNGQGKLLISFSPSANYAEVRAIEVIDEGR